MLTRASSNVLLAVIAIACVLSGCTKSENRVPEETPGKGLDQGANQWPKEGGNRNDPTLAHSALLDEGKHTFRYDTFGDEAFWGGALQLHKAIQGSKNGGVGDGVSPKTALSVGLKVDMEVLPASLVADIKANKVNMDDVATTLALLKLNAVVGVTGFFNPQGKLMSMGIQCALCHSTVDNAFAPGIGRRLDGWANRDLNIGAIVAMAPNLKPFSDMLKTDIATIKKVLNSWGPGRYDAVLNLDGKAFRPDGKTASTLIPPAFGLAGVNLHTYTGWGTVSYWNSYVANLEMHGQGTFSDSRLDNAAQFPVAARTKQGHKRDSVDRITPKLAGLHAYQLSIPAPTPPKGSFEAIAAERGRVTFSGKAKCATCHVPPLFTEPGWNMHKGSEIGIDDFQANRSPDKAYRTTPLKGLFSHSEGGFYHDGRFGTLAEVVHHYDTFQELNLTDSEQTDLVEYLKSL